MFHKSQNNKYLELITNRAKKDYLVWVEQFLDLITENLILKSRKTLNDIGCCVGQFWKGLKKRNLNIAYNGYDIENKYLKIAKSIFPELYNCLFQIDITKSKPHKADISIVSATIEHFKFLSPGLDNILGRTKEMVLLRTFLGENSDKSIFMKSNAQTYYYINQYSFREIFELFEKHGFASSVVRDRYTDSMPRYLGEGIIRNQYIVIGKKM